MKKSLAIFAIIISLIISASFSMLFLSDYNTVYKNFLSNIKVDVAAKSITPIKINKFPYPYIVIDSINEEGKIELQNVEIRFSLVSLLKLKPEISNLKIGTARVNLQNQEWDFINHEKLISEFLKKGGTKVNIDIANLYLLNELNNPEVIIKDLSLLKDGSFKGQINSADIFTGYFLENKNEIKFQVHFTNSDYEAKLVESYDKDFKLVSGNVDCNIKKLANFLASYLPDVRMMFAKLTDIETVNIKFDITPSNESISLKNIIVSSQSIDGKGQIILSKLPSISSLIELKFPKIDLGQLLVNEASESLAEKALSSHKLSFAGKLLKTDISVETVNLSETDKLSDVKFLSELEGGKLIIEGFTGKIDSDGHFSLIGEVEQNAYRSLFEGKVHIKHRDLNNILENIGYTQAKVEKITPFILTSDLKCTVIDFYLQNLNLKTDDLKMSGSISSKFIGATPRVKAALNFSSIDLNKHDYPVISPLQQFVWGFSQNMKDSNYLNKFIPIRTISYLGNFDIIFNNLLLNGKSLGKVNLLMNVAPSKIYIDNLYINTGIEFISTNLSLQAGGVKPEFDVKINDGIISGNFLSPAVLLDYRNSLLKDYSVDKVLVKIDGALSQFTQGDIKLEDVRFKIENDNILFKLSDLQAKTLGGNFKGEGSILLEPYTLNFVYALNSIDLPELSKILPQGLYNNVGRASINGMFSTNGDSLEKLLYNLYVKSSFVLKDTTINKFNIDGFVEDITNKDYNVQNLDSDIRHALLTGQTDVSSLDSDLELAKGVLTLKNTKFQTKYTSAALSASINIYDFGLNLTSAFSFYPMDKVQGEINKSYNPVRLNIKAMGTIFEPQKTADSQELLKALQFRKK